MNNTNEWEKELRQAINEATPDRAIDIVKEALSARTKEVGKVIKSELLKRMMKYDSKDGYSLIHDEVLEKVYNDVEYILTALRSSEKKPDTFPCADPNLDRDCTGCTDERSEGTHAGCTKQHGHIGCDKSLRSSGGEKRRYEELKV